uniref:Uncharacterized protein n=1 Tax=Romanomermis culicivorax TaxID=13658 RepID=A0A915L8R8_ROMCU
MTWDKATTIRCDLHSDTNDIKNQWRVGLRSDRPWRLVGGMPMPVHLPIDNWSSKPRETM